MATRRVSKKLQQGRSDGEGTKYRGDNTCKKRYNLDPGSFFVNRFWGRRADGVAINEARRSYFFQEFKRSTDREGEVKDAKANEQHKNIIGALKTAAPEWEFE